MLVEKFNKNPLLDDQLHTGEYDPQSGGFSNGTHHGGEGSYNRWTLAEWRKRVAELFDQAAVLRMKNEESTCSLRILMLRAFNSYGSYSHVIVRFGNLEFNGEEMLEIIDSRIARLTTVKKGIDDQLADPRKTEINISEETARQIEQRLGDRVTVHRRDDGSYYLNRSDARTISDRLCQRINMLHGDRECITGQCDDHDDNAPIETLSDESFEAGVEAKVIAGETLPQDAKTQMAAAKICNELRLSGGQAPAACTEIASGGALGRRLSVPDQVIP